MLLDLLKTDNYIMFNKKLAHTIGLNESIYVNQLLNITGKAIQKEVVFEDGYFKLDRKYIYEQTTLTTQQQLEIDSKLMSINLLTKNFESPDLMKLNLELLANITTNENVELNEKIKESIKRDRSKEKEAKEYYVIQKLCKNIQSGDVKVDDALEGWIKALVMNKGTVILNSTIVETFKRDVFEYSKGNIDVALAVINKATVYLYRECSWAIKKYESDKSLMRNNVKEIATRDSVGKIKF